MAEKTKAEFGKFYEDRRTHRSGKLLEYNEKYKTYLFEDEAGKTFNVTSSQFNINWVMIEREEVQEVEAPIEAEVVTPRKVHREKKEEPKELNELYTNAVLLTSNFVDSFERPSVTIKMKPYHNSFKIKVKHTVAVDIDIRPKSQICRIWLNEYDNNRMSWTIKPLAVKKYPGNNRCYITEFEVQKYPDVLEDLKALVIDKLAEIEGGIKNEI